MSDDEKVHDHTREEHDQYCSYYGGRCFLCDTGGSFDPSPSTTQTGEQQ